MSNENISLNNKQLQFENSWVADKIKVIKWDNLQNYEQFDLTHIHSNDLDNNIFFKQLKDVIISHNKQVKIFKEDNIPITHALIKNNFVAVLYKMLFDLCIMNNKIIRQKYLKEIYKWANQTQFNGKQMPVTASTQIQSRPNTSANSLRPFSGVSIMLNQPLKNNNIQKSSNLLPIRQKNASNKKIDYQYDSIKSKQLKKPIINTYMRQGFQQQIQFLNKNRTKYQQYEVPILRLKDYKRKQLDMNVQPEFLIHHKEVKPSRIKYQIKKSIPIVAVATNQQSALRNQNPTQIQSPGLPLQPLQSQISKVGDQPQQKEGQEGNQNQEANNQQPQMDLGGGQEEKGQQQQPQIQQVPDKLKPRLKPYIRISQQQQNPVVFLEQQYRRIRKDNELKQKLREQEDLINFGVTWARQKSRWQKEQIRKKQSKAMTLRSFYNRNRIAKVDNLKLKDYSNPKQMIIASDRGGLQNQNISNYQNLIDQNKLQMSILNHGKSLNLRSKWSSVESKLNVDINNCLTSYNSTNTHRSKNFSQILMQAHEKIKQETDPQILKLKQRLAKNKVVIDISKMKNALGVSQEKKIQLQQNDSCNITGRQLLKNPFFKVSKKKKKKKKK